MQSSYKVIKSVNAVSEGNKEIATEYIKPKEIVTSATFKNSFEMESVEKIAAGIIENAQRESKSILREAYLAAREIENNAIEAGDLAKEQGFQQGYNEGREIGYNEGHEEGFKIGEAEGNEIIKNANFILFQAKEEYEKFLKERELHLRELIITTTESILKREVKNPDSFNDLIFEVLSNEKNQNTFIIKCSSVHYPSIQSEVVNFKNKLAFRGDIFVIEDNLLDDGTILIEKDNGITTLSIEYSLEKLKEILMES